LISRALYKTIEKVRTAVRTKASSLTFVQPLHNNESRLGYFIEDPTLDNRQKVAHLVEYRLNGLLSRLMRLFELFEPVEEQIEEFALKNKEEVVSNFIFRRAHSCGPCHTIVSHETSSWTRIHPKWIYPLQVKRIKPVTIMVAIMTAVIAASIVTIFNAVEIDKLKTKQQKAEIVTKLRFMASLEISNSQTELIRLTSKVVSSLLK
jgi:hypothetical protein